VREATRRMHEAASTMRSTTSKMRLLPLIGATYFMVAGGPYGLEDIIGDAGYGRALLLLLAIPFVWSLPTSLMVGELASAIPCEGGFYQWVRRALGPFWGFQEAWLSLAASVFDMAIYPAIFVAYLGRLAPALTEGHRGLLWKLAIVLVCTLWNLNGARAVGKGAVVLFVLLLSPFVVLIGIGVLHGMRAHSTGLLFAPASGKLDLGAAVMVAMWNYMGWDNASTVAQEVEDPQRNYPRAMLLTAGLVALTYILPLAAVAFAGFPADQFTAPSADGTGRWTDAALALGGPLLALAVVAGGTINGAGMFNALTLSYTRLPFAMAEDGLLPRFLTRRTRAGVPWASVLVCAVGWALALNFTFDRLISIDLILYGASLVLEFVALAVLRRKEPDMPRPFKIPGGLAAAIAVGVGPTLLIGYALYASRDERLAGMPSLAFGAIVAAAGPLAYLVASRGRREA
jgi:amino acid transporter